LQKNTGRVLFSAGHLVDHLECAHATTLSFKDLAALLARAEDDDTLELVPNKGFAHEEQFLESYEKRGVQILEMPRRALRAHRRRR
jgi:hypothetical protein